MTQRQRQEISIARTILQQPRVVVLDEATSAMDAAREERVHSILLECLADSTLVSIAHRLSNIVHYDRVVVMGEGKVLEDGNPGMLLKKPMGFFSALWRRESHRDDVAKSGTN